MTPRSRIQLSGGAVEANGSGPFFFGPWGGVLVVGDFNKTPWDVDPRYAGALVVRGFRIDGAGAVAFGFWPAGFGTPAARSDVPVVATRRDYDGRTVVYQSELDLDPRPPGPSGWRGNGNYWSLPAAGCYALQADGDGFTEVTVVRVA